MAMVRTPVWLVTGYLGAGKTTLLARWLAEPALAQAALVVNEIGEVSLDDRLLARAVDSASLVANACICCTGLPGLDQALTDLWWDRLHRRRPAFDAVVIETTGLADPGPVIEVFQTDEFLRTRYALAGVLVMVSATTPWTELAQHPEALSQVRHADLLVVTKVDRAEPQPVLAALRAERPEAALTTSARASLGWSQIQTLVAPAAAGVAAKREVATSSVLHESVSPSDSDASHADDRHLARHDDPHADHHHHGAQAHFIPCPVSLDRESLAAWANGQRRAGVQRLKGVLQAADGRSFMAQWALGDDAVSLVGFEGPVPRLGLTCIA